ncbi:MAG: phosphodiester glycosidase family protein [Desulfatibacillaceae bacterium]
MRHVRLVIAVLVAIAAATVPAHASGLEQVAPGLWVGSLAAAEGEEDHGHGSVAVVRCDPSRWSVDLYSASELGHGPLPADAWSRRYSLAAVVNASMYQSQAPLTSTGYMRHDEHANNPYVNPGYGAFFVAKPKRPGLPPVRIVDRYAEDWRSITSDYGTVVQNYRMIGQGRKNVWRECDERYSMACVATDGEGNVLFLHTRRLFCVKEFNNLLLKLPLDIEKAMYVEGGPEASLYFDPPMAGAPGTEKIDRDFRQYTNRRFWPVPNVIGVRSAPSSAGDRPGAESGYRDE